MLQNLQLLLSIYLNCKIEFKSKNFRASQCEFFSTKLNVVVVAKPNAH